MFRASVFFSGLSLLTCAAANAANTLDLSKPMICATTSTAICERHSSCVVGSSEAVNLPTFWKIDPKAKTITSTQESGAPRTSAVTSVMNSGDKIIMQGADSGVGWTMSINPVNGKMVGSAGRELGFIFFGTCTAL